jgi:hypothetical protein
MPPLLPNELLYSFLGRVAILNNLGPPKRCLQQLFGSSNIIPSPDLPTRLQALQERLGDSSPFTSANELIEVGTLYSYHRPFLSPDRADTITRLLLRGGAKGLKALLGRLANRFGANPDLRFCAQCVQQDIATHGIPYWHRSHQLPGVTACPEHEIILLVQEAPGIVKDKQRFILPPSQSYGRSHQQAAPAQQVAFSILSNALLNSRLMAQDPLLRKEAYETAIKAFGLCKRGHIHYPSLAMALCQHYRDFESFYHKSRLLSTERTPLAWLRSLVDKPNRSCHPICHLILIGFLFGSLDNFLKATNTRPEHVAQPDGGGQSSSHELDGQVLRLYRDSSLSCRKVACLLGLSVTSVVSRRKALGVKVATRQKYLDRDWLNQVADCLQQGIQVSKVASMCAVSVSTVYRVRAERSAIAVAHQAALLKMEKDERRRQWTVSTEACLDAGVKAARAAAPATYAWLRRNDRYWLQLSYRNFRNVRPRQLRVDWAQRDLELSEQVKHFASALKLRPGRPRISRSLLLRQAGEALFRENERRLPRLKALVDVLEEPPFSYELHRLDMAIRSLEEAGERLVIWRLQRAAGIKNWTETHTVYAKWKINRVEEYAWLCAPL